MSARARQLFPLLLVLVITAGVYSPVLRYGFLDWDDTDLVMQNPGLQTPNAAALLNFWKHPYLGLYTPMAYTLWMGVAKLGMVSCRFHAINLLLHLLVTTAVYAVLRELNGRQWAAAWGAAIFGLHPLQVEPVAWISGMNNLLAGDFSLIAIWLYLRWAHGRSGKIGYAMALLAFTAALLSKPIAVSAAGMIVVLDRGMLHRSWRSVIGGAWPWWVLATASAVMARVVQTAETIEKVLPVQRLIISADSIGFYVIKLVAPWGLTVDYGRTPRWVLMHGRCWLVGVLVLGILIWIARSRRFSPSSGTPGEGRGGGDLKYQQLEIPLTLTLSRSTGRGDKSISFIEVSLLLFILGIAPLLGLTSFNFQKYSTVADRYVYLAMLGPALLICAAAEQWRKLTPILMAAAIAAAVVTITQVRTWQDDQTLFERNLQINPTSLAANQVLGYAAARRGDTAAAMRYDLAALQQRPGDPTVNFAIGNLLLASDPASAAQHFTVAAKARPDEAKFHNNLGVALAKTGRTEEAAAEFEKAIALSPQWPDPRKNLAAILNDLIK